jgi:hypothetical protein
MAAETNMESSTLLQRRSLWIVNWVAISRSIELSHGGTLVAERGHPTGCRFSLNLPVRPSDGQSFGGV